MNFVNYADVVSQMQANGLLLETVTNDQRGFRTGELVYGSIKPCRCKVRGGGHERRGWYWLHEWEIEPGTWLLVGTFGIYRGDDAGTLKVELTKSCGVCGREMGIRERQCPNCGKKLFKKRELSPEQTSALKARLDEDRKKAQAERAADIERAAHWATAVWRSCREAGPDDHDYLKRKRITDTGGIRILESLDNILLEGALKNEERDDYRYLATFIGALVVPMCDPDGRVCGLQFILSREKHAERIKRTGRDKDYWPSGLEKLAHYWLLGGTPNRLCLVAEGYATAVSLHQATGLPVVVAFDANNLLTVAQALNKHYRKRVKFLFCGDDDWIQVCLACQEWTPVDSDLCHHCHQPHRKNNAGLSRAKEAALATGGAWIVPTFATPRPDNRKGPNDFNDLHEHEGIQVVRAQIEQKLAALEWGIALPAPTPAMPLAATQRGGATTGGEGEADDDRPTARAIMPVDDIVERFIPLDDGTGKLIFDTWKNTIALQGQMIALLPAGNRSDDIKRHPLWAKRGAYYLDQVGFDPAGDDPQVKLNTWRGWPMKPAGAKEGSCERQLELLEYLCRDDPNGTLVYRWLLCWMAYPLQNPGAKLKSAIIMHGPQGTGKSTIFKALARIYGAGTRKNYSVVLDQRALQDNFNADWENRLFILTEEAVANADKWSYKNELKELVTGETIRIRKVFTDAYYQRNRINFVFISNEHFPLPLDNDDRRHLVVWCPPALDPDFYREVHTEIENGGVEALYRHLLDIDIPTFCPQFHPDGKPPMTDAKEALLLLSSPSEIRFTQAWLLGETPWPVCPCLSDDFYTAYQRWCTRNGEPRPRPSNHFYGAINRLPRWEKKKAQLYTDDRMTEKTLKPMVFPPPETLVAPYDQKPGTSDLIWRTQSVLKFREALATAAEARVAA